MLISISLVFPLFEKASAGGDADLKNAKISAHILRVERKKGSSEMLQYAF
jgi:hypothetical protein